MELTSILVCEDELLIANRLQRFIEKVARYNCKVSKVSTLSEAFDFFANNEVHLLFLDLNLHGKDGFEILKELSSASFYTIVVSAHTDRAIEAFEYGVIDFIGKPFTEERVKKALDRFEKGNKEAAEHLKYLAIKSRRGVEFISIEQVNYIKAAGIYSEIILLDNSIKVYDKPLNQTIKLLPEHFWRVHKSYIVPITHITSIKKRKINSYDVQLKSGTQIPISRTMRKKLLKQFNYKF